MRVFIALELSQDNRRCLHQLQLLLQRSQADVRWVGLSHMHLTLAFMGEITPEELECVKAAAFRSAMRIGPAAFSLAGIGCFPSCQYPRIIWVGVTDHDRIVTQIAQSVREELAIAGISFDAKAFRAHITLGRVSSQQGMPRLMELIDANKSRLWGIQPATEIHVMASQLSPHGPKYQELANYQLGSKLLD